MSCAVVEMSVCEMDTKSVTVPAPATLTPPNPQVNACYSAVDFIALTLNLKDENRNEPERQVWANPIEFLLSCISMSVGLGHIWRFPKVAYKNGGGAFLIPYLVVLVFIGNPLYFLEMALGQFSSNGPVKIWQAAPILKGNEANCKVTWRANHWFFFAGVGYANTVANGLITTYYTVLIAMAIFYFFASFQTELPWTVCDPEWKSYDVCYSSKLSAENISLLINKTANASSSLMSSSSIYFK